jgi:hypothetical protein
MTNAKTVPRFLLITVVMTLVFIAACTHAARTRNQTIAPETSSAVEARSFVVELTEDGFTKKAINDFKGMRIVIMPDHDVTLFSPELGIMASRATDQALEITVPDAGAYTIRCSKGCPDGTQLNITTYEVLKTKPAPSAAPLRVVPYNLTIVYS